MSSLVSLSIVLVIAAVLVLISLLHSIYSIGPTQIGLVRKRFGAKLPGDNPLAFRGEAGYQAQLLMPGLRFKFGLVFAVTKHPWVQVPAGQIGVVIAQVGQPLPIGAKSAVYKPEFGNFTDLNTFIEGAGQKGVQRPVLSPGTLAPIHPVAFIVITKPEVFGRPISSELSTLAHKKGGLTYEAFGLEERQLEVTRISPHPTEAGRVLDMVGVVTTLEGEPLPAGDIASRLGGFKDIDALEAVAGRAPPPTRDSSRPFWATKMTSTALTRIFRGFCNWAARSDCNTTHCCTARTTSTLFWSESKKCPCWSSSKVRSP